MTRYELLVFLHVTAVIVWLGAGALTDLLWFRAERARDPLELRKMGELQEWLAPRLFIPASLSALVFGVLAAWEGPWTFGELWIVLGLAGFAFSFVAGLLFLKPQGEKMKDVVMQHGPTSAEAQRHARRLLVVARIQLLVLFLAVADMTIKPSTDDPWTLVVGAAILAAAVLAGVAVLRRPVHEAAPAAESS
jgi:hypothetical protein